MSRPCKIPRLPSTPPTSRTRPLKTKTEQFAELAIPPVRRRKRRLCTLPHACTMNAYFEPVAGVLGDLDPAPGMHVKQTWRRAREWTTRANIEKDLQQPTAERRRMVVRNTPAD